MAATKKDRRSAPVIVGSPHEIIGDLRRELTSAGRGLLEAEDTLLTAGGLADRLYATGVAASINRALRHLNKSFGDLADAVEGVGKLGEKAALAATGGKRSDGVHYPAGDENCVASRAG